MKKAEAFLIIPFALLIVLFTGCDKETTLSTPPVAFFKLSPANGLTTTVFQFDAKETKATQEGDTLLFLRWDWDNDSIWDTGFSRARTFTHRYYKPGTYSPRLEVRNEGGLSDTMQITVQVDRGNSAPRPAFTIAPASGNLRTEFIIDASPTKDDEDSLSSLRLVWDWDGDGVHETETPGQTLFTRTYNTPGIHYIGLQVIDPQNVSAYLRKPVTVYLLNDKLIPDFTWSPAEPTTSDTVVFDGSPSRDPENPDNTFQYRWDFEADDEFDTEYLDSPTVGHQFLNEGSNSMVLEIRDKWGLINQKDTTIWILHSNLKPTAAFLIGCDFGNLTTNFFFNAGQVSDEEDYVDQMRVRWDFESDGHWDTEYSKTKTANHQYSQAGTYRIRMEVIDSGNLTDTTSLTVSVSSGTNETGLIDDKTNNAYYGTIKIGSQWWMSENLNAPAATKYCYSNRSTNCTKYGGLYTWTNAMNNAITEKAKGICPTGWHIPSITEWEQLFSYLGDTLAKRRMEVGGDSEFMMLFAGQRSLSGRYEFQETVTTFWSSTKAAGENAWVYSIQKDRDNLFKMNLAQTYGLSVRCIKD